MKKVYLETFGCQMNVSDSERIATTLEADGFEITNDEDSAEVILFNTCSVREKAEHKLYTRIGQVRKTKQNTSALVGVLGCVAQLEGETLFKKTEGIDFVLGTKAVGRISNAIEKASGVDRKYIDLGEREADYDWSVSENQRHSQSVAFVPVIEGCNKFCTYCIVPFSRGRERSLPASNIVRQVLELRRQGVREIHLIGQNVNSYRPKTESGLENFTGATPFSRLLRAVAATGIERIKFTTSFPRDFHPDIVDAIDENENLCNWVHLPVQSGSDRILKAMRRGHTIENYLRRIDKIRASRRNISLTTDIIVGFPGETDEDFQETLRLAEYCQFEMAYLFKYSPRPGTPAFDLPDDVSAAVKTARFLELEKALKQSQFNGLQKELNKTVKVLAEGFSNHSKDILNGHTTTHKVVNFEAGKEFLGQIVNVRITECKSNTLFGKIV
ncbi:MAG TPA: tRNA (N6-isopentenyl adenosine(37)-C2)-methylthiotransferase MiaB [Pyrinomonadaceae bacterium]|jgi:tRNA-2-methylthio-N6-dimethylallyladenosine synthase